MQKNAGVGPRGLAVDEPATLPPNPNRKRSRPPRGSLPGGLISTTKHAINRHLGENQRQHGGLTGGAGGLASYPLAVSLGEPLHTNPSPFLLHSPARAERSLSLRMHLLCFPRLASCACLPHQSLSVLVLIAVCPCIQFRALFFRLQRSEVPEVACCVETGDWRTRGRHLKEFVVRASWCFCD